MRLTHLRLFPSCTFLKYLIYVLFFIKNLKNPTNNFNINTYISFSVGNTRSCGVKLRHNALSTKFVIKNVISILIESVAYIIHYQSFYLSMLLKAKSNLTFGHFITNFDPDNIHKLHYLCPCGSCILQYSASNYHHL